MSTLRWIVAGVMQAAALALAWFFCILGVFAGPAFGTGHRFAVVALEVSAAVTCLPVPGWVARRTRHRVWWAVGVVPALLALGIGVAVLTRDGW